MKLKLLFILIWWGMQLQIKAHQSVGWAWGSKLCDALRMEGHGLPATPCDEGGNIWISN